MNDNTNISRILITLVIQDYNGLIKYRDNWSAKPILQHRRTMVCQRSIYLPRCTYKPMIASGNEAIINSVEQYIPDYESSEDPYQGHYGFHSFPVVD